MTAKTRSKHRCEDCEPLGLNENHLILPAYRTESGKLAIWCHYCELIHYHSEGTSFAYTLGGRNFRQADCEFAESPHLRKQYCLHLIGPFTKEIRARHRNVPRNWKRDFTLIEPLVRPFRTICTSVEGPPPIGGSNLYSF